MFIKAKSGLKIRVPGTKLVLSEDGQTVPDSTFWRRRLLDGDVVPAEKPDSVPAEKYESVPAEKYESAPKKEVFKKDAKSSN